ncbi:putative Protein Daple [Hypsibius exemplaris]|uniref:HOOK N-terminal domain-containing protein n=1 Tax=Hypsibius exemplaris TaxID=2072580 RepID=A0A1W0X9S1_HYPEX|nr:putative Protein Daple [Hypsibius exemplaris]
MDSLWPVNSDGDFSVPDFLQSPLVHWALSLSGNGDGQEENEESSSTGERIRRSPGSGLDLCNSRFLKDLLEQMEPQLISEESVAWQDDPVLHRLSVLESLVTNLRAYFTDHLGQIMVMRPPDILFMCQFPGADHTVSEMRKLLCEILSFAVQSGRKEEIIERIQGMDEDVQKGIVECIKEVTDNPLRVWKVDTQEPSDPAIDHEHHDRHLLLIAHQHIRNLVMDRQELIRLALTLWKESNRLKSSTSDGGASNKLPASPHHAVEVADLKTQIRRVTQELYECQEELKECKEEMKTASATLSELRDERGTLEKDARLVKVYRDELDILYEKDKASQKLEGELSRYRSQLVELEYYKNRIEELEQNWKLLTETKNLLENQLESARKRTELIPALEKDLMMMRHDLQKALLQSNSQKDQVEDLLVANAQLGLELKRYRRHEGSTSDEPDADIQAGTLSLSDQLHESLSSKVLRLEIENEQLKASDRNQDSHSTSCRHCQEKDSAIGTAHTRSEDACSTGESSVEGADHERQLESDPGYDTIDFKYSSSSGSALPDSLPTRHLKSTEFLLNHVFDNSSSLLREENFRLKEEIVALKAAFLEYSPSPDDQVKVPALRFRDENSPSHAELASAKADLEELRRDLSQLTLEKSLLQDELSQERKCCESVCAFLTTHNISLPDNVTTITGAEKGRRICDGISSAFTQKESAALQRSHHEILDELESLKGEYEKLRVAHHEDLSRMSIDHEALLTTLQNAHREEKSSMQKELRTAKTVQEKDAKSLEEMRKKEREMERNVASLRTALENENRSLRVAHESELRSLRSGGPSSISVTSGASSDASQVANQRLEAEIKSLKLANSTLKRALQQQEREKESLVRTTESSQNAHSSVMADHESLQHYHQQLNTDYEKLTREVARLKSENKRVTADLDDAKRKMVEVAGRKERDGDAVRVERLQRLEGEYEKLLQENESLRNTNRQLGSTYRVLTEEHKVIKTEVSELKLKKLEYEGVVFDCQNQVYSKEIEANKHTEILLGIIASLEDEKRSFAAAIERLVLQYDDVFLHSWREKNEMKTEHKDLQDKLHALDLQKQLLIQKLYDTFKATEARKRNMTFLKRVRRAAGELVGRSRSRDQSRHRTISPTDSAADSSSVESNGPPQDFKNSKTPMTSTSMHSFKSSQIDQTSGIRSINGPQFSYSSDDLRKQTSSASSSCISPTTDQSVSHQPYIEPTSRSTADPAFHRVGSRRGVYRPHTTAVVHHPAIKEKPQPAIQTTATQSSGLPLDQTITTPPERRVSVSDSVKSSSERKKGCCGSYGGYHDCTMLNYTRLSATAGLTDRKALSDKKDMSVPAAAGDRSSQTSSGMAGTPPPYHSPSKASLYGNRATRETEGRSNGMIPSRIIPVKGSGEHSRLSNYSPQHDQARYPSFSDRASPAVSVSRASDLTTPPAVRNAEGDSVSSWSFSASFNSVNLPRETSVSSTKYFASDAVSTRRSQIAASPGPATITKSGTEVKPEDQVWFEYGCV